MLSCRSRLVKLRLARYISTDASKSSATSGNARAGFLTKHGRYIAFISTYAPFTMRHVRGPLPMPLLQMNRINIAALQVPQQLRGLP